MPFKYRGGERQVEDVTRRSKQAGSSFDSFLISDVTMLKVREGENQLRIMPPSWEEVDKYGTGWELQVYIHYNIGPDNVSYLCLDKMKGEACPVCEARRETRDPDEADALRVGWRGLAWAIDRANEKAGPQVWGIPATLFKEINARSIKKGGGGVIKIDGSGFDAEEDKKGNLAWVRDEDMDGYDVLFNREGTDQKTKYNQVEVDREPSSLADNDKTALRWLDYIEEYSLPTCLQFYEYDYIKDALFGKREKRGKEEPEAETGTRRRRPAAEPEPEAGPRRRRATAEPAEEDEGAASARRRRAAEPEEPEPEPESATRRRRPAAEADEVPSEAGGETARRRRPAAEPEPEAETAPRRRRAAEPESEPEEEPPPRSRRPAAAESPTEQAKGTIARFRARASK